MISSQKTFNIGICKVMPSEQILQQQNNCIELGKTFWNPYGLDSKLAAGQVTVLSLTLQRQFVSWKLYYISSYPGEVGGKSTGRDRQ